MESMEKEDIDKLERIGKNFTSKIKDLEKLRELKMYSMNEGEIYMIIKTWQQIENIRENI